MNLSVAPKEIAGHGLLDGKVVVVTAAAGTGIGSATARRALAEGADVVISDHHERRLGETAAELSALGLGRVEHVVCDVTSTAQVDALIDSTTARMGRLDVLVNNAGLGGQTPVADMTDDEWDRVLDVSLTSVFRATRAALRYFRDAPHGGVIVNNASVLGWRAQHSQSHYAAAKAGVMALTRCSAIEAAEYGVRPVRSSEVIWLAFGCCGGRTPPAGSVGSAPAPYATRMLAKSNPTKPPVVVVLSRLP